jgi:nitrite reductase/ring-hydroxylating ferredoxin subunit
VKVASPEIVALDNRTAEQQPHWRQEFPIDSPQDDYRSRRDFTKLMVITSFAFFVGQAWIVLLSRLRRARGEAPLQDIASVDELPVGGAKLFHYPGPGDASLLVRVSAGQFVAYGQKCTHLSCPVIPKPQAQRLHCPCHEGSFDLRTGQPLAGPPRRPLPRILLSVRGNRIYATGVQQGVV